MSEPTPLDLPVGLRWVKLVCRLGRLVTDSAADADAHPDLLPVGGKLMLAASPSRVRIQEADGRWRSVEVAGRTYTIRADGELVDNEGRVGVYIPDPASLLVEPQGYAITAVVKPTGGTEWSVTVGGDTVLPDVVDLVAVSSVGFASPTVTASFDARLYALETGGGVDVGQVVEDYLAANPPASAPDATTTAKGIVRLAGDLGGTADAPTVPGLADKADADHDHAIGDVTGLQTALDGKQAAGSYAAASHDHAAADIDSGAATDGHILTADGAGGAAWEAPPAGGGSGSGIELVSGTVTLDSSGTPIREFYATGSATINGVSFPAGTAVVFRRDTTDAWAYIVVDGWTPITPPEATPTAPTFTDPSGTADDEYTIPAVTGVIYKVDGVTTAAGTYPGSGTVTVTAEAEPGWALTAGTTTWTHTFSTATDPIEVTATAPTWTDDTVNGGGSWTTPTITGVTYDPASGTASPGQSVTVTATAQSGYTLTGDTSWTHGFPAAPSDGAVFFTDFSEHATGTTSLPGWTPRWNSPSVGGASGVQEDSGATGGKVFTLASPSAKVGYSLDQFDGSSGTAEVVTRWKAPFSNFIGHAIRIFGSGDNATANAYYANFSPTTSKAAKYVAGSASDVGTPVSRTTATDTWSWARMRVEDGMVYLRWWADGETEPATWNVSAADTSHTTGWVGIGSYKDVTFDVVGIATDGSTAPKEAP